MTTTQLSVIEILQAVFPIGSTVTAVHLGTTRPRQGTSRSDVMILAATRADSIQNVSPVVGRITLDPIVTAKTGQKALRILGRPGNPVGAAVESLAFALHGRTDALTPAAL